MARQLDDWICPFAAADDQRQLSVWQRLLFPILATPHLLVIAPISGFLVFGMTTLVLQWLLSPATVFPMSTLSKFLAVLIVGFVLVFSYTAYLSLLNGMAYLLAAGLGRRLRQRNSLSQ
ncbi:MAG: hypothetical protein AAGK09_01395 [Planctomycetota bacterium]